MEDRCEICRRYKVLKRHVTEVLMRGEENCDAAGDHFPYGWIGLCIECHGSVHRKIESDPDRPMVQVDAVSMVIDQLGRAFLHTGANKIVKKEK